MNWEGERLIEELPDELTQKIISLPSSIKSFRLKLSKCKNEHWTDRESWTKLVLSCPPNLGGGGGDRPSVISESTGLILAFRQK